MRRSSSNEIIQHRTRRASKEGVCNKSVLCALSAEIGTDNNKKKSPPSRSNSGESLRGMIRRTSSSEKLGTGSGGVPTTRRSPPNRSNSGERLLLSGALLRRTLSNENLMGRKTSKEGGHGGGLLLCNKSAMMKL